MGARGSCCGPFTDLEDPSREESLVEGLTDVADCIRDIGVDLGSKQYSVSLVWTQWSGGQRGSGDEVLAHVERVLPVPLVSPVSALRQELTPSGLMEAGQVRVTELSPRFSEHFLMGRAGVVPEGKPIPDDVSFYWEVYYPGKTHRRRFLVAGTPSKDPTAFEWTVELVRAYPDRDDSGALP